MTYQPIMKSFITQHIDLWTSAQATKTSGRGISASNQQLLGIQKLRELILELAVRGKLVPQDEKDEPAGELLKRIEAEKKRLVKDGKIKKQEILSEVGDDEKPFELPVGWVWTKLGNLATDIHYGYNASADHQIRDVRLLRITDIQDDKVDWESVPGCEIENRQIKNYQLENGDILIARTGGTIGKSYLVQDIALCSVFASYLIRVKRIEGTYTYFIKTYLGSMLYWNQLYANSMGTGQPNVNGVALKNLIFPLPPLPEQHRIVAKVDELMALCDTLEKEQTSSNAAHETLVENLLGILTNARNSNDFQEAWKRIAAHFDLLFTTEHSIDKLKQTILQLAVMGKLVPQDPNDEPASVLLKKIATEKAKLVKEGKIKKQAVLPEITEEEKPFELPEGWEWCRLGEIAEKIGSGSTPRGGNSAYCNSGIIFLRSQNVRNEGLLLDDITYISELINGKMANTIVFPNDILLNITGGSLGRSTIFPESYKIANVSQHVTIIRLIEKASVSFIYQCILSPYIQNLIWGRQVGANREGLSKKVLELFEFPIPPLSEQHHIVSKVEELFALCDSLKERIRKAQGVQNVLAGDVVKEMI